MGISVPLRSLTALALIAFGLLVSTPRARADEFVLERHYPSLQSLMPPAHRQAAASRASAPVEPICDIFANGYDVLGATPCAGCFDKTLNFTESDVDCGGGNCKACSDGLHCATGNDCSSHVCNTATSRCAPATCANNMLDGTETDIDCGGGVCPACSAGHTCNANGDCASNACNTSTHTCVSGQCVDQHLDGGETDTDCGGLVCPTCAVGKMCILNGDCTSVACDFVTNRCVSGLCFDERVDGAETDTDCGGGTCATCAVGKRCRANTDCGSNACDALSLTCVASQCVDNRQDGVETDIDCGGLNACSRCSIGHQCLVDGDCLAGHICNGAKVCQ